MESEIVWLPDFKIAGIKQANSPVDGKNVCMCPIQVISSSNQNAWTSLKQPQSFRIETQDSSQRDHGAVPTSFPNIGRRKANERLADDKIGEELAPDATVWELYQEEANEFDSELANGRGNNLDMMLLFVSQFSLVVHPL